MKCAKRVWDISTVKNYHGSERVKKQWIGHRVGDTVVLTNPTRHSICDAVENPSAHQ